VFDLTGCTVLVIEPLDSVIVAGDVIEIPTREGGTRATPILGAEFLDRRLSSSESESSLALVVTHLPAAGLQAPVDAEVWGRSLVALSGFEFAILNRACRPGGQTPQSNTADELIGDLDRRLLVHWRTVDRGDPLSQLPAPWARALATRVRGSCAKVLQRN